MKSGSIFKTIITN